MNICTMYVYLDFLTFIKTLILSLINRNILITNDVIFEKLAIILK